MSNSIDRSAAFEVTKASFVLIDGDLDKIDLPNAAGCRGERIIYKIASTDHKVITLRAADRQTIDNAPEYYLDGAYARVEVVSDGHSWWIVSEGLSSEQF